MRYGETFWEKYGAKTASYVITGGIVVVLLVIAAFTCTTSVDNTQVGIVVNNITGSTSLHQNGGTVFHMPFGLSTVYQLDRSQRVLAMTAKQATKPARQKGQISHEDDGEVSIKTNDGSNVEMDVEVVYQLQSSLADQAYRELGPQENIDEILRALVRSRIRSHFGDLSTLEIAEAGPRSVKLRATQEELRTALTPLGIEIVSINAQNFSFAGEYDKIIRERKEADQILANQKDYQDAATEEGKRMIAEATRDKQSALAQLQGDLAKQLLGAEGDAKRLETRAQQAAYQAKAEGELALKTAEAEAAAIQAEGVRKAEAMGKLFEAYEQGGDGLVKEALVKLYKGVTIKARPFSPSDRIEQIQVVPQALPQIAPQVLPAAK
jgi:regulator of protease activity HflC (stomatin/prohibitin superfamily)